MWQDILLSAGNFALAAALIPTILAVEKPSNLTSLLMFVVLASFAVAFVTMSMTLAAAGAGTCSFLWLILLIQKLFRR